MDRMGRIGIFLNGVSTILIQPVAADFDLAIFLEDVRFWVDKASDATCGAT